MDSIQMQSRREVAVRGLRLELADGPCQHKAVGLVASATGPAVYRGARCAVCLTHWHTLDSMPAKAADLMRWHMQHRGATLAGE